MAIVKQFGTDGVRYDTDDYPFVLILQKGGVLTNAGRFSNLELAHKGRLMESLNNPNNLYLLFNGKTNKFYDWRKEDLITFEKYKNNPSDYFDKIRR